MDRPGKHLYEFGPFLLDPAERLLLRDGRPVHLTPKCFDILAALVEKGRRLTGKDELLREIWPGQFVEESNLTFNISALRKVLREGAPEQYIETVPKRGYRFVADLKVVNVQDTGEVSGVAADGGGGDGLNGGAPEPQVQEEWGVTADSERLVKKLAVTGATSHHKAGAVFALTLVIAVGGYFAFSVSRAPASISSVAVLPFANAGNDPNAEYLSDGLSESLINSLSQLPQLKVTAHSSAFKYKGKEVDPQEAAKALGVQAIVTGRVIERGDDLQISVELMNASDKTQMWGGQYHRRAADLQAVQAEVARTISEKLRLRLTGAQERQLTKRPTENAQAYQLYLTGMFHARKGNLENFRKALDYYNQALALDPNFALAYASMPAVYSNLAATSGLDPKEALAKGKAAAQKALELDETLAQAHNGLAHIKRQEWDWSGAESEYKRAIELDPNFASAHSSYALYLAGTGRTAEALTENKRAQELDPFRIVFKANEGGILYSARRYDEAVQAFQNVLEMQPDYAFAHIGLGHTYAAKGMYAEAVSEYRVAVSLNGETTDSLIDLGYVYAMSGKRNEALAILNRLKASKEYVSPGGLATLYAGLSDKEAAFQSLERAYSARDIRLLSLKFDPHYDSLRADPRFRDLVRRVGLPQ